MSPVTIRRWTSTGFLPSTSASWRARREHRHRRLQPARIVRPCDDDTFTLTLTRGSAAGDGLPELLGLIATMAAGALAEVRR